MSQSTQRMVPWLGKEGVDAAGTGSWGVLAGLGVSIRITRTRMDSKPPAENRSISKRISISRLV